MLKNNDEMAKIDNESISCYTLYLGAEYLREYKKTSAEKAADV